MSSELGDQLQLALELWQTWVLGMMLAVMATRMLVKLGREGWCIVIMAWQALGYGKATPVCVVFERRPQAWPSGPQRSVMKGGYKPTVLISTESQRCSFAVHTVSGVERGCVQATGISSRT